MHRHRHPSNNLYLRYCLQHQLHRDLLCSTVMQLHLHLHHHLGTTRHQHLHHYFRNENRRYCLMVVPVFVHFAFQMRWHHPNSTDYLQFHQNHRRQTHPQLPDMPLYCERKRLSRRLGQQVQFLFQLMMNYHRKFRLDLTQLEHHYRPRQQLPKS